MHNYGLPIQVDYLTNSDIVIDMNNLTFPVDESAQERSALLFIRNTNLTATFDFSNCSYERKEIFLMSYMTGTIQVYIPELIHTWVSIIANKYANININSILTIVEIGKFISDHKELIDEIINITGSIPLCSIISFFKAKEIECPDKYELSDYCGINGKNYFNLLSDDNFVKLIELIDDITPKYYVNYFMEDTIYYSALLYKLPYLALLNAAFSDEETSNKFIEELKGLIESR